MKDNQFMAPNHREEIDEALAAEGQQAVRSVLKSMPEDSLSMSWRSSLNEKLVKEAALRRRRTRIVWILRPALGLGLACTLGVLLMVRTPQPSKPAVSHGALEAALVTTHRQSSYAWDLAGVGLSPLDWQLDAAQTVSRQSASNSSTAGSGWSEDDLDTL